MRGLTIVAAYAIQEAVRRRIFHVVLVLTVAYLLLYWLGARTAFDEVSQFAEDQPLPVEEKVLTGATLFGLSMFGTLFLGAVLAAFLTLGAVRGDAERGLLQPIVVRPIGRSTFLLGRFAGAVAVCVPYVLAVYVSAALITRAVGGWWPDQFVRPGLQLAGGVVLIAALAMLGSLFLSATANGIAVFMVFGGGLLAGLLGQIGEALNAETLQSVARTTSWVLPFEALYQDGLHRITAETTGFTRIAVQLGPFGGAQSANSQLLLWSAAYLAAIGLVTLAAFSRKDL